MNRKRLIPVVVLLGASATAWFAFGRGAGDSAAVHASGTIEATDADLGFQAGGRIVAIGVQEGERVTAAQELARLDPVDLDARRAVAQAQLDAARAVLAEAERGARPEEVSAARAVELAARERMEEAERIYERTRTLEAGGAVSRESLEHARSALAVARAQHQQFAEQTRLIQRGARTERIDAQRAIVRQAEAAVAQVNAAATAIVINAPFAGIITVKHREAGEAVGPGAPVVTLMDPASRWVRIYVSEDAIGRVSIGQLAEIRSDSHPDRVFSGRVTQIASEAEFTPRNVQTPEERAKLVYAVKVSISGDTEIALKPGVPADVTLTGS